MIRYLLALTIAILIMSKAIKKIKGFFKSSGSSSQDASKDFTPNASTMPAISSTSIEASHSVKFFSHNLSNSEDYSSFKDGARPENTKQLAYWLRQNTLSPEQTELLQELALSVIDEFAKHEVKSPAKIREVVALASIPVQR